MKILIWIKREEAVTGSITKYYTYLPFNESYQEWVQVEITQDEFTQLEDDAAMKERLMQER
ncbi:MAG: hypothetical protein ACKVK6_02155 [bacterium]|jgi:hypothetical protein|tara:strand:+ start:952 stop:1134 length:183 start_codon:yes stop_codon:yes gene_type:complete